MANEVTTAPAAPVSQESARTCARVLDDGDLVLLFVSRSFNLNCRSNHRGERRG